MLDQGAQDYGICQEGTLINEKGRMHTDGEPRIFISGSGTGMCDRRVARGGMPLLLASQSGRQSQEQVRGYARRAERRVHGLADKATEGVGQVWRKGRELINDKQAIVTEAVKVGRAALHRERERVAGEQKA